MTGVSKCAFIALIALVLFYTSWFISNPHQLQASSLRGDTTAHRVLQELQVPNKATFLYIVGVEGVGHHGVTPALATIGRSCQNYVHYEDRALRSQQKNMMSAGYVHYLKAAKENTVLNAPNSEVLFIEDSSFPTDSLHRHGDHNAKKSEGLYNLEWVYENAKQADVDIKFLYLNRDFYRTVMSHPEFDGDYQTHANVLHDYVWYINEEYKRIEAKESGLWRQINYEWFTQMENCTNLVTSLVDFIGWSECDVEQACKTLQQDLRPPTKRVINEAERAYIAQFNVTLPIPTLNLTIGGEHQAHSARASTPKTSTSHQPEPLLSNPLYLRSQLEQSTAIAHPHPRLFPDRISSNVHLRTHRSYPAWNTHATTEGNRRVTRVGGAHPTKQF